MTDQNKHGKTREFERFPLDFLVEVSGLSRSGNAFSDFGTMCNISGRGLCFSTPSADCYTVGQKVVVHICLPDTDGQGACMVADARVIWIHASRHKKDNEKEKALIGMKMNGCMAFETRKLAKSETPES